MKISRTMLDAAVNAQIIAKQQAEQLWDFWSKQQSSSFNVVNLLFYIGGLISILSVILLLSPYILNLGRWWMVSIFTIYLVGAFLACYYFRQQHYILPASFSLIFAIGIFPLWCFSIYALIFNQNPVFQFLSIYNEHQLIYQLLTLLFSLILFTSYRFPLLLLPILLQIWYLLFRLAYALNFSATSILFSSLCLIPIMILRRQYQAYLFWFYTFAGFSLWLGIAIELANANQGLWMIFIILNILLLYAGLVLEQLFFNLLSGIGIIMSAIHLFDLMIRQWQLPWLLVFSFFCILGIGLLRLGVFIQQQEKINSRKQKSRKT